jgi:hypothetical protein
MVAISYNYPIWVEYWAPGDPHGHLLLIKNDDETITMQRILSELESLAAELAEMFYKCGDQSHGKGIRHSHEQIQLAYEAAVFQLLTTDYQLEWSEIKRNEMLYKKWGGPMPAMVLLPSIEDPQKWEALIPDKEGDPHLYQVRKGILEDIMDPRESSKPNKYGLGWTVKNRRKLHG